MFHIRNALRIGLVRRVPQFSLNLFNTYHAQLNRSNPNKNKVSKKSVQSIYQDNDEIVDDDDMDLRPSEDGVETPKETSLVYTVTPELETEIVGDNINQKFIFKQALAEIIHLENMKLPMPMPSSLSVEEWRRLISLTDRRSRFHYIDSLREGEMTFEEIQQLDGKYTQPLEVSEQMIEEVCGDDDKARMKINMLLFFIEEARQIGESVPAELTIKDLKKAVKCHSKNSLRNLKEYLNAISYQKIKNIRRKRCRSALHPVGSQKKIEDAENCEHLFYSLGHNSIMLRLNDATIKRHDAWNAWREHAIGQPLVIDFSYLSSLKNNKAFKSMIMNEAAYAVKVQVACVLSL